MSSSDRDRWDTRHMAADDADPAPSEFLVGYEKVLPKRGHALDIACGRGRNAVWLARRGLTVDAIDISTIGLAKAKTLAARHGVEHLVRTIEHDLRHGLPELDPTYAVVLCLHFRQPSLWPRLPDLVAAGGVLLIETLARHPSNLDVDPEYLGEMNELVNAAGDLVIEVRGRATAGKRAVERLLARRPLSER